MSSGKFSYWERFGPDGNPTGRDSVRAHVGLGEGCYEQGYRDGQASSCRSTYSILTDLIAELRAYHTNADEWGNCCCGLIQCPSVDLIACAEQRLREVRGE